MKKDILNTIISLGLMFLVGGCCLVLVINESNHKTSNQKIRTLNHNDVVTNSQTRTEAIKPDSLNKKTVKGLK